MAFSRPPRGYTKQQHPLIHSWETQFPLDVEDALKSSTMITLFRAVEATGAEDVEVNPSNLAFAEDAGPAVFMGSIVPRISVQMTARIQKVGFEIDAIAKLMFKWMPIYTSFLNSLDAENVGTPASDIETILELEHDVTEKKVQPIYNGTKLLNNAITNGPLSTVSDVETFADYGYTTNQRMEGIAFDEKAFWDAKSYYTNKGMLNKVTGRFNNVYLDYHRKDYTYSSNNFTNPIVKRGNPYTGCFILFHAPQADEVQQLCRDADVTTSVAHIWITLRVRFEEWNPDFDQTSI